MTKFQAGTMLTSQVMDCKIHVIGKATRSLFADPVTIFKNFLGSMLPICMQQKIWKPVTKIPGADLGHGT